MYHEISTLERIELARAFVCVRGTRAEKLHGDERNFVGSSKAHDHKQLSHLPPPAAVLVAVLCYVVTARRARARPTFKTHSANSDA